MTRAVLLAFLTLCSARVSVVTAAQQAVTCSPGKTETHKLHGLGAVQLTCPSNFQMAVMAPRDHPDQAAIYLKADMEKNEVHPLGSVLPGAGFFEAEKKGKPTSYRLLVTQLPPQAVTIFFPCQKEATAGNAEGEICYIGIEVPASPRLGPNTCSVLGTRIDFAVEKEGENLQFSCGDKKTLHPADPKKTLDESCTSEVDLFDGAALSGTNPNYQLTVQSLPSTTTTICYLCVEAGGDPKQAAQRCEVRIVITGKTHSGAHSVGVAARTAAALGLCLSAVASVRIW